MKNLLFLFVCFFLLAIHVEAATVHSVQDGDFFAPETWENNQVPNLLVDSIVVEHDLRFGQDIPLSGSAHLHIKFCVNLCGNFNLILNQNTSVFNEGELFASKINIQGGYFFNQGRVDCTGISVTAGKYENGSFGYARIHQVVHDCSQKYPPERLYTLQKLNETNLRFDLRCFAEIDFGDSSGIDTSSNVHYHEYTSAGSFVINITLYCPCDTASFKEPFEVNPFVVDTSKACPVFNVFPNPNKGAFRVNLLQCNLPKDVLEVPFYNSAGQFICFVYLNQNGETPIDMLPHVASGVYYLAMPPSSGIKPQKIVIIK